MKLYREECVALWGEEFTEKCEVAAKAIRKITAPDADADMVPADLVLAAAIAHVLRGKNGPSRRIQKADNAGSLRDQKADEVG